MNRTGEQFIRYKYGKSLQYEIQLTTNELKLKSDEEMQKQKKEETFYSQWGHYETLGKVDVSGEWKDMINPAFYCKYKEKVTMK